MGVISKVSVNGTVYDVADVRPTDVVAQVGSNAIFTTTAYGPDLTYQWQYKSPTGTAWTSSTLTGNKTATFTVPATAGRNGYQYRCQIKYGTTTYYTNSFILVILS